MKETDLPSEFDIKVDSILNTAYTEKEKKRKKHWWNNMCPVELGCIIGMFVCVILIILDLLVMAFGW